MCIRRIIKIKQKLCIQNGIKAQVSLEIALSLICVFILLFGSLNVFLWVNKKIVHRQQDYEASRQPAGDNEPGKQVDETNKTRYPNVDIFKKVK